MKNIQKLINDLEQLAKGATSGPWHYYPCGEKSNDCLLGVAFDENGKNPSAGEVNLHPYNEDIQDYEMDKYDMDVIAVKENNADYSDFAYMSIANPTNILKLISYIKIMESKYDTNK